MARRTPSRYWAVAMAMIIAPALAQPTVEPLTDFQVIADGIPMPLAAQRGNAQRGRAIVGDRQVGMCLLCHTASFSDEKFQGTLAPSLDGAGSRWTDAQLRLRIVDGKRINPDSIMPAYYRIEGLTRVGAKWQGKPILNASQVEDVVAYLVTLK